MNPLPGYSVSDCDQSLPIVRPEPPEFDHENLPMTGLGDMGEPYEEAEEAVLKMKQHDIGRPKDPYTTTMNPLDYEHAGGVAPNGARVPEPHTTLRRVTACVNACRGIDTETLERSVNRHGTENCLTAAIGGIQGIVDGTEDGEPHDWKKAALECRERATAALNAWYGRDE